MKLHHIFSFVALALLALLSDCKCKGKDPEPDARINLLKSLTGTWKVANPANDITLEQTKPDGYKDFVLTISGTDAEATTAFKFTTSGLTKDFRSPWPAAGTFSFDPNSPKDKIKRNDQVNIDYVATATTLKLTFNFQGDDYIAARTSNVKGNWVFDLTKQP